MQLNAWGMNKTALRLEEFDSNEYRFAEKVRSHLNLRLVQVKGDGQPAQVALEQAGDFLDPDRVMNLATPFFSSLDALDYFCRRYLQQYLALDPGKRLPDQRFWHVRRRDLTTLERIRPY